MEDIYSIWSLSLRMESYGLAGSHTGRNKNAPAHSAACAPACDLSIAGVLKTHLL